MFIYVCYKLLRKLYVKISVARDEGMIYFCIKINYRNDTHRRHNVQCTDE
jgi:hypothetical protein